MGHFLRLAFAFLTLLPTVSCVSDSQNEFSEFPEVKGSEHRGWFPLADESAARIIIDDDDFPVVGIAAEMLADDLERVTGKRSEILTDSNMADLTESPSVIAGTIGHSSVIDSLVSQGIIDVTRIIGRWESFLVSSVNMPDNSNPLLVIAGSDRRGTAYGLTSLSEAMGVSPWYWWADVTPQPRKSLYVEPGCYSSKEPSVQYRGIFINDERLGG